MAYKARPLLSATLLLATFLLVVGAPFAIGAEPSGSPPEMFEDAELADVHFLDPDRGWAVGDRGVIWRTDDGGEHWRLQPSPTNCRLESIHFVDTENGWIVGGWTHPYTHTSHGVVLRTMDGGRRWQEMRSAVLPALKVVKFFDVQRGWAAGNASVTNPTGIFSTADGGRTWTPLPSGTSSGWLAADFRLDGTGAVAGRDGTLSIVRSTDLQPSQTPSLGSRHLRRLRLMGPTGGWLVGDGGLVMQTQDGGLRWQSPGESFPVGASHFDFYAVATHQEHCWVAGSPGSCIFHSPDGGKSWETLRTRQSLPIHALTFLDRHRGWAVGALGTILATRDGGRTWRRQHSGGTRAALLGLFSEGRRVPLELFALLSGNGGYLGVVEILNRRDVEVPTSTSSSQDERTHQAVVAVGACGAHTAWRYPLRQSGLDVSGQQIVDGWNTATDGRGTALLEEDVVRQIRQWRPDVIVTEHASPSGEDPLSHLINQIVLSAVQRASDRTMYSEQITVAGLQPWKVSKVFSSLNGSQRGSIQLNTAQLAARLGRSLADHSALPRGVIDQHHSVTPQQLGFQLLASGLPDEIGGMNFFSGLALPPNGEARRRLSDHSAVDLETLRRIAQRRRNVQQMLSNRGERGRRAGAWIGQVEDLTGGLNPSSAGDVLYQLATGYHRSGDSELAAEAFEALVERYPDHPLSESAIVWLIQYFASGEATWRLRSQTSFQTASTSVRFGSPELKPSNRAGRAVALAKSIEKSKPILFAEPRVRFPQAAAHRLLGFPREAEQFYHSLVQARPRDAWWACAQSELSALVGTSLPPKQTYKCIGMRGKPYLDGRLDDVIWADANSIELKSALGDDAGWPAVVMLAHDQEFLYWAVSCKKPSGVQYEEAIGPRPYDGDLSQRDRVDLMVDVDRDYSTYYRLTVDHRGWTGDACLGDKSWNPNWYVASSEDDNQWTVEAAIPLIELAALPLARRTVWAVGVQRTAPRVGFQSWTRPAAVEPQPEGFGLLLIE